MKAAICDDDIRFTSEIESLLEETIGAQLECEVYLSAEEMLKRIEEMNENYQMYVLDIEMDGMNGMEAAAKIREKDQDAIIIFMTSHVEKMPEAFDVNAFHYLLKPIDKEKARDVLHRAAKKILKEKKFFSFQENRQTYMIPCHSILCFESHGRKICVYTEETIYEYYGTLKDVLLTVDAEQFARVHHAFVINLDRIESMGKEEVVLRGNIKVPVSRTYRKAFLGRYQKYVMSFR